MLTPLFVALRHLATDDNFMQQTTTELFSTVLFLGQIARTYITAGGREVLMTSLVQSTCNLHRLIHY